jgi:tRNA/tmRNA/rRNA uracil-C5-methylase (TrmA/RlmC/RlmD family)
MVYYVQSGAQATLVLKTGVLPGTAWLDEGLVRRLAEAGTEGLWLHLHPSAGHRVFAKRAWHLAAGRPRSVDEDGFAYGPTSFQQLLPGLYRQALDEAEAFLAPAPGAAVVDLYCGTGTTLARWTRRGAAALGVELDGEAVACAGANAPGAAVLRGACSHRLPQLDGWARAHPGSGPRLLYANPPRTGLEPEVLAWIAGACRPARLAYLSCSAGTLRRDLHGLTTAGYRVLRLTPYDFFPQTHHVETLALLAGEP